jgi:iron complex transport system substrate-binding protein
MRRACAVVLAGVWYCASPGATAAEPVAVPAQLKDDRGVDIRLAAPARRIVTLAPSLTELAFAAGAGDALVGVSRVSLHPAAARALPVIGDAAQINYEQVLALKADLALAWLSGNAPRSLEALARLKVPVFAVELRRLDDVPRVLRLIGTLAGTPLPAAQAADDYTRALVALRAGAAGRAPVTVFYAVWDQPLMTVNGAHLISDVLRVCGGRNVFADAAALAPTVSLEAVLAARPAVILGGGPDGAASFEEVWRRKLAALPDFRPRVAYVDPEVLQSQGPRVLDGARAVCAALAAAREQR